MNRYEIRCTEEQARKAFKLGAHIMTFGYGDLGDVEGEILKMNRQTVLSRKDDNSIIVGQIPTAEQMLGWLEEQGILVSILYGYEISNKWAYDLDSEEYIDYKSGVYSSREEATNAAINAALEYLLSNKNK